MNSVIANTHCYDDCGFPPLLYDILFSLVKLICVRCSFLVVLF